MSAFYLVHAAIAASVLVLLFSSFATVFASKYLPSLRGLAGGFVLFLALNELLAVPFTFFHLKYKHYLIAFFLLNFLVLLLGAPRSAKKLIESFRNKIVTPYMVVSILLLIVCLAGTQLFAYYTADDSIYVSLVEQNKGNNNLYTIDPSTGNSDHTFSRAYRFQGWELMLSGLSDIARFSSVDFVRGVIPLAMVLVVYSLFKSIFSSLLSQRQSRIALVFFQTLLLLGAYSVRSQAVFFLPRSWQGKGLLAMIIIPLFTILLYRWLRCKSAQQRRTIMFSLFCVSIAAIALNPTSIFLCFALVGCFGLIHLVLYRNFKPLLWLGFVLVPFLPPVIYTLFHIESKGSARLIIKSYLEYLSEYIGSPGIFILLLLGLAFFWKAKQLSKDRLLHYIFPLFLMLSVLNPLFQPLLSSAVTSTAYWRLFWLLPVYISLPIAGVVFSEKISSWLMKKKLVIKKYAEYLGAISVVLIIILSGNFMYGGALTALEFNTSSHKTPLGVKDVSDFLDSQKEGTILASEYPATYLHNFSSKHVLFAPRSLSVRVHYEKETEDYIIRQELRDLMNGEQLEHFTTERFWNEIRRFGIDYIVYEADNDFARSYVDEYTPQEIYRNYKYAIFRVQY